MLFQANFVSFFFFIAWINQLPSMVLVDILIPQKNPVRSQSMPQQMRPTKNHEEPPLLDLKLKQLLTPVMTAEKPVQIF